MDAARKKRLQKAPLGLGIGREQEAPVPAPGLDLLTGETCSTADHVPPGAVRVLRLDDRS